MQSVMNILVSQKIIRHNNVYSSSGAKWCVSWDKFYLSVAFMAGMRSNAVHKEGACLVDSLGRIIGFGYSGVPLMRPSDGTKKDAFTGETRNINALKTEKINQKLDRQVIHGSINALIHKTADCYAGSIYITKYPCHECAKQILASGIQNLYYVDDENTEKPEETEDLFEEARVNGFKVFPVVMSNFKFEFDDEDEKVTCVYTEDC